MSGIGRHIAVLLLAMTMLWPASAFAYTGPQDEAEQAIVSAEALFERFQASARMIDAQGESTTLSFTGLFSPNAHLPLDFIQARMGESVSPQKYVAEYYANDISGPLTTEYEMKSGHPKASRASEDGSRQVTIYFRSVVRDAVDEQGLYLPLIQALDNELLMDIQVSAMGTAEIIRIIPLLPVVRPNSFALDLQYLFNMTSAGLREDLPLRGLEDHQVEVRGAAARLSHAFTPFGPSTADTPSRLGVRIGLGLDYLVYTSPELTVDLEESDYLEDDPVIGLLNDTQLNDQGSDSQDFVFSVNDRLGEEVMEHLAFKASLGLTYRLGQRTQCELAYGFSSGSTVEVEKQDRAEVRTTFAEGHFADSPVVITDGDVSYQGHTIPYQDPDGVYGLRGDANSTSYAVELVTTTYAEFRLIQVFNAGTFALSGLLTVRQHLSSPLPSTGDAAIDLQEVVVEGVPRTVAFTERFTPMYFGLGLRLQKNN